MDQKGAIALIEQMIRDTKEEVRSNGFYFLLWGSLVFAAAIINFYLLKFTGYVYNSIPWLFAIPAGVIITLIKSISERKNEAKRARSFVDVILRNAIIAFAISMFVVCLTMPIGGHWKSFYPVLMVIYAIWLYVSGSILRFKPLTIGAYVNWFTAATGFIWIDHGVHLLLIAVAVLAGFVIPGYMLERRFKNHVQTT